MSGKTAGGLVLVVIGVGVGLWGLNVMSSFGHRLARELGMQDNTGPIAIGVGVVHWASVGVIRESGRT
jgi:hypothetical protein